MSVDATVAAVVTTTLAFVISQTWKCLCVPATGKNPIFGKVFFDEEMLLEVATAAKLTFCPGLLDVVQSPTPPDISFFKKTPSLYLGLWGVYNLVLEKAGCKPLVYIGEASHKDKGVQGRWRIYNNPHNPSSRKLLPSKVKDALDDGYKIVHKGVLVWCSIPSAKNVPRFRLLYYVMEAMFSFLFWAMFPKAGDYQIGSCCPWPRESFTYGGLCSHSSLNDLMRADIKLSAEELEQLAAQSDALKKARQKRKYLRMKARDPEFPNRSSRESRARQKAANPEKVKAKTKQRHVDLKADTAKYAKRTTQLATNHQVLKAKRFASREFWCEPCLRAFKNKSIHDLHKKSKTHKTRVKDVAAGKQFLYRCEHCFYSSSDAKGLHDHKKTPKHLKNAAAGAVGSAF